MEPTPLPDDLEATKFDGAGLDHMADYTTADAEGIGGGDALSRVVARGRQIRGRRRAALASLGAVVAVLLLMPVLSARGTPTPVDLSSGSTTSRDGGIASTTTSGSSIGSSLGETSNCAVVDPLLPSCEEAPPGRSDPNEPGATLPPGAVIDPATTTSRPPDGVTSTILVPPNPGPPNTDINDPSPSSLPHTIPNPPNCNNSFEPQCGDFYFDPKPDVNQPITVTVVNEGSGTDARLRVTLTDPDAPVDANCVTVFVGDGADYGWYDAAQQPNMMCAMPGCMAPTGRWDPPAKQPGSVTFTLAHRYAASGTYAVRVTKLEAGCGPGNHYAGSADQSANITVG